MRLRRKPWIDEAIKDYTDILYMEEPTRLKGKWNTLFPEPENPIHVEFGTGKGRFISRMASVHPDINYIGMEVQEGGQEDRRDGSASCQCPLDFRGCETYSGYFCPGRGFRHLFEF